MPQLMDLVKELKHLNARKKAGEALSPTEEARRKELKVYLRSTLEQGGGNTSLEEPAVRESTASKSSAPRPAPVPASAPKPVPVAVSASSSAPKAMPIRGGVPKPPPEPLDEPLDVAEPVMSAADVFGDAAPAPAKPAPFVPKKDPFKLDAGALFDEAVQAEAPKPAAPEKKPFVPRKDAFAIDAGSLIDDAAKSEAVSKVDPSSKRPMASRAELEDAEARAEAALRANKKRERAANPEQAIQQLKETEAAYTPPEESFVMEQYYGAYADEGYQFIEPAQAGDLKPIDPREMELQKLDFTSGPGGGAATITVPPGLAFIDDFPALYARKILPPPDDEVVVDSSDPNLLIPGKRKVTVHLLNGEKRQGAIRSLRRGELGFKLEPLGSGQTEELSIAQVKAVFIHLQPNAQPKDTPGRALTVTFRDARQVQGVSDDYQPGSPVFTLIPPAGRGQFERIIINGAAVQSVG